MRITFTGIFCLFLILSGFAQSDTLVAKSKSKFYVAWGYTRAWYTKSDIHFEDMSGKYHELTGNNNYYNFTIYDVKAKDKPDFKKLKDVVNITIPQFIIHMGYMFNQKWGFELNYDHTKYVVNDWQKVKIKGQIFGRAVDGDTLLNPDRFLHFEHTDGANFMLFNAVRRWDLIQPRKQFSASWVVKPGIGFVYPRTDVTIFGEQLNNNWHVAGWIAAVESGLRLEFMRNGFMEFVGKGAFANYTNCLVLGIGNGTAYHHFFSAQLSLSLGFKFDSKR